MTDGIYPAISNTFIRIFFCARLMGSIRARTSDPLIMSQEYNTRKYCPDLKSGQRIQFHASPTQSGGITWLLRHQIRKYQNNWNAICILFVSRKKQSPLTSVS